MTFLTVYQVICYQIYQVSMVEQKHFKGTRMKQKHLRA